MGGRVRPHLVPLLGLLVQVLVFHRGVLFSGGMAIPYDLAEYHLPLAEFIAASLREGRLPLWDPYTYCGFPFFANITTQLFYPPAWPVFLLGALSGGQSMLRMLEWQIVLHLVLAGVFAYFLFVRLGLSRGASFLGATVFQLGGYFASQAQHLGAMNAGTWLPLAWMGIFSLRTGFSWRWTAITAFALALAYLAGFPAVTAVILASCGLLAVLLVSLRLAPWKLLLWVPLAGVLAGAMAAVGILPAAQLMPLSVAHHRGYWFTSMGGAPLEALVSLVIPNHHSIFDIANYHLPYNFTFLYLYCGWLPLLLIVVALFAGGRLRWVFAALTVVAGLWMLGQYTPVGPAIYSRLPAGIRGALYSEFAMLWSQLGMASLAALGAARVLRGRRGWVAVAAALLASADLTAVGSQRPMNSAGITAASVTTPDAYDGSRELVEGLRKLVNRTIPPARMEPWQDSVRWVHHAPAMRLPTASGNEPLALDRVLNLRRIFGTGPWWTRYFEADRLDSPLLDLLDIRYLVTVGTRTPPAPKFKLAAELPFHRVWENRAALPRFFLVPEVCVAGSPEAALAVLRAPGFDPRRTAVVEGAEPVRDGVTGTVRVLAYGPREFQVETAAQGPSFLVTSEPAYPGWRAYMDGSDVPIRMTNGAFRGLPLPPGLHRVVMRFEPAVLPWSAALSVAGMVLSLWLALKKAKGPIRLPAGSGQVLASPRT